MKSALVRDWMTSDVVSIAPGTALSMAHRLMVERQVRRLPVVKKNGKLVGVVTRGDIRGAEPSDATTLTIWEINYLLAHLKIKEIMTPKPLTVSSDATLAEAANLMLEHKVSGLPVVDKNDKVVGIITESDLFRFMVKAWPD